PRCAMTPRHTHKHATLSPRPTGGPNSREGAAAPPPTVASTPLRNSAFGPRFGRPARPIVTTSGAAKYTAARETRRIREAHFFSRGGRSGCWSEPTPAPTGRLPLTPAPGAAYHSRSAGVWSGWGNGVPTP